MKLFKLSQSISGDLSQNGEEILPEQQIDPKESEEIRNAISGIQIALASMNKSISIIESSGVSPLFQKNTLIGMIQSGDIQNLDLNKIQSALAAMDNISKSSVTLNHHFNTLNSNQILLQKLNLNYREIQENAIRTLNSGNFSQFEGVLSEFNSNLQSQTGLT